MYFIILTTFVWHSHLIFQETQFVEFILPFSVMNWISQRSKIFYKTIIEDIFSKSAYLSLQLCMSGDNFCYNYRQYFNCLEVIQKLVKWTLHIYFNKVFCILHTWVFSKNSTKSKINLFPGFILGWWLHAENWYVCVTKRVI